MGLTTHAAKAAIHLVVLDIMMLGKDGLSLCRWLVANDCPSVLLQTAMADKTDRIVGLGLGADDDFVMPFTPRDLAPRVARKPAPTSRLREFANTVHDRDNLTLRNGRGPRSILPQRKTVC